MKNAWRSPGAGVALLILLTVAAYLPVMHAGFIWDDGALITGNPMIKANDGLYRFWFTTEPDDYWPLTSTAWWLEWRLWGDNPTGYHLVNVLLHAVNAVLVWMILQRLKIPGAWMAGLVFAIHPVNVATVAWISEQKNTQSMLFYELAILSYLKFDEQNRWHWYGFSLAAFLLALLSKAAVVMLPAVLLGCVWWTRGQLRWKDFLRAVPFFILSAGLGLVTVWFQYHRVMGGHPVRTEGFAGRLAAAGCVPWFYLSKALLPVDLMVIYPRWQIDASRWVFYLPGIALLGWLIVFWWKRDTWGRPLLFALGYFVATLFPVLGFFDLGFYRYSLVADHWQYIAIVAPIALAVAGGMVASRQSQNVGVMAGTVVILVLGAATCERSCTYQSDETLWRDTVAKNPRSWLAHTNLGETALQAGMEREALEHYEQALRIKPDYAPAHYDLGLMLWRAGKTREAVEHWEQALRSEPDLAAAHYTLGVALIQAGRTNEAMQHWEQTVRIDPDDAEAHNDLGSALFAAGRIREAIEHYERAVQLKPDFAEAHCNLGGALWQAGKVNDAIGHYEQALRIKPDLTEARNALARLRAVQ